MTVTEDVASVKVSLRNKLWVDAEHCNTISSQVEATVVPVAETASVWVAPDSSVKMTLKISPAVIVLPGVRLFTCDLAVLPPAHLNTATVYPMCCMNTLICAFGSAAPSVLLTLNLTE